jgi:hypothetical protein
MNTPKCVIEKVDVPNDKHWWWRLKGLNGEVLAYSEVYSTKWSRNRQVNKLAAMTGFPVTQAKAAVQVPPERP